MTELMRRRRALMSGKKGSGKSDMNGWTDGVKYSDITIYKNEYYKSSDAAVSKYNGWDRTGYIPCDGASYISLPPVSASGYACSWFFNANNHPVAGSGFTLGSNGGKNVTVPNGAVTFGMSDSSGVLEAVLSAGVVPHK